MGRYVLPYVFVLFALHFGVVLVPAWEMVEATGVTASCLSLVDRATTAVTVPVDHSHGLAPMLVAQDALDNLVDVRLRVPLVAGTEMQMHLGLVLTTDLDVVGRHGVDVTTTVFAFLIDVHASPLE